MSQFKLNKIRIRNWMTIRDQEIEFPAQGLIFVSGHNSGGPSGFESIGTGKTSLGEALAIAVTGIRGRFASFGHYSTKEKGNTLVEVEGKLGDRPITIQMGHRCKELSKTGEGLKFSVGDKVISRSSVVLTRAELGQVLGITPELASWTTYIDGDKLDFSSLSQAQSVELLMASLSQPSWSTYHLKAKKTLDELERETATKIASRKTLSDLVKSTQMAITTAKEEVKKKKEALEKAKMEMASQLNTAKSRMESARLEVSNRESRRKEIKSLIKSIEDALSSEFKKIEAEEMAVKAQKANTSQAKKPLVLEERRLSLSHSQYETSLRNLRNKPQECPTCRKPWDRGPSDVDIKQATQKVEDSLAELLKIQKRIDEYQKIEDEKQNEIDQIQARHRSINVKERVRNFSDELDQLDEADRSISESINSLTRQIAVLERGPSDSEVIRAVSVLEEKQKNLEEHNSSLSVLENEIAEIQELCKIVAYWVGGFSPIGIPNMVLSRSIGPLNHISLALSHRLSGGTLSVSYETTKELVSGEQRNSLHVLVRNSLGASRVAGNSKGESGLNNLIIAETINEVGRVASRIGFRWYDEVISNQDPKVRMTIINYLKETAHRLGILIFVVDHHPEVSAMADYVLRASKDQEGITTFKWIR